MSYQYRMENGDLVVAINRFITDEEGARIKPIVDALAAVVAGRDFLTAIQRQAHRELSGSIPLYCQFVIDHLCPEPVKKRRKVESWEALREYKAGKRVFRAGEQELVCLVQSRNGELCFPMDGDFEVEV